MNSVHRLILSLMICAAVPLRVWAQNPHLLKDINPCTTNCGKPGTPAAGFIPGDIRDGIYYFAANNGTTGMELWRTDGTTANTWMIKEINSGSGDGVNWIANWCWYNGASGLLYFAGNNGANGVELFATDGTAGGTTMVKNIFADSKSSINSSSPDAFTVMNGITYFKATVSKQNQGKATYYKNQLFRTDGTSSGTYLVKDLDPTNLFGTTPNHLRVMNNVLYFAGFVSGYSGFRLCRSDGTANGTSLVHPTAVCNMWGLTGNSNYSQLTISNNHLFFGDFTSVSTGLKLWSTDGTQAGTTLVKTFYPATGNVMPRFLVDCGGVLYFTADDGVNGAELWRSDGSPQGTYMVKDINPGSGSSDPYWITPIGNTVYFTAIGPTSGAPDAPRTRQLWKSDGTAAGTALVQIINPSGDCEPDFDFNRSVPNYWRGQFPVLDDGRFFFSATDGVHGMELWSSDGTTAGTAMVKDINTGSADAWPNNLRILNGKLIFRSIDPGVGEELFVYDPAQPVSKHAGAVESLPAVPFLAQNFPNPFSAGAAAGVPPSTTIRYFLPSTGYAALRVYDMLGREIATLAQGLHAPGENAARFDAGNLPSGVYIYRLETDGTFLTRRMLLVK